jgi:hypothetical protein
MIGDLFGPGDTRRKVVQLIAEAAAKGDAPIRVSNGKYINPISVQDVAEMLATSGLTNLVGRPEALTHIQYTVRQDSECGGFTMNADPDDPFPIGVGDYNLHYKTFLDDLHAYVRHVKETLK